MTNDFVFERAHRRKANMISFAFHIGLLLLAFFSTCDYEKAIDKQYAVALNFEEIIPPKLEEFKEASNSNKGKEAEGAPRKNADKVAEIKDQQTKTVETKRPEVKLPKPTPAPPTPTDPVVSETTFEDDTEITAAEEEIEIESPEPEAIPEPIPEPVVEEPTPDPAPEPEPAKESVKTKIGKILDVIKQGGSDNQGNPDGDPSRSDGKDGSGEGKKGSGAGRDESGNDGDSGSGDGGAGVGEYDGSGNGVFGRRVIYRNLTEILRVQFANQEGKRIVAKFCVNRAGIVTYAELLDMETTADIPPGKDKAVLKGVYGYKVEPDPKAPSEQCGKLSILLDKINAFGG